jgi:sporulation protein YlmC with PRC-barrel domain
VTGLIDVAHQILLVLSDQQNLPAVRLPCSCSTGSVLERKPALREYTHFMHPRTTARVSLTALLGTPVTDSQGHLRGRLQDIAVATGPDAGKVAGLVLKTRAGLFIVPSHEVMETPSGTLELRSSGALVPLEDQGNYLYLRQDLVDRQIIDIHGRKVVRVNDVDLEWMGKGAAHLLRVAEVEVGLRGAFRRVFKGLLPRTSLEALSRKFAARGIPWQFVDVIEVDPARRVKLRIEYERLAEMHPSDLAEILEDLAPAEREAVFTSLDEEVAADTLEEVDPKLQKALLEKLGEEKIADIVEEMDPGAAADLLAELSEEQSDAILEEMEPEERQEVSELLEFDEDSAAGCMTTDFVYLGVNATVSQTVHALRSFDGDLESVTEIYLLDERRVLRGAVPLARLVMAQPETRLAVLAEPRVLSCPADLHQNDLAEMFDKYNLHALPVVDAQGRMVGVVQADHVIAFLREKL